MVKVRTSPYTVLQPSLCVPCATTLNKCQFCHEDVGNAAAAGTPSVDVGRSMFNAAFSHKLSPTSAA